MGICASLCRVDTTPHARARAKERPPSAAEAAAAAAAPHAPVSLGFASGFAERYELGDELGHGQFAVVRAARERASGDAVAVKLVPKALLNDAPDNAEHIRREVRAATRCAVAPSRLPRRASSAEQAHPSPPSGRARSASSRRCAASRTWCCCTRRTRMTQRCSSCCSASPYHILASPIYSRLIACRRRLCSGGELFDRVVREGHLSERRAAGLMRAVLTMLAACHLAGVVHRDIRPENLMFASPRRDAPLVAVDFGSAAYCAPGQLLSELAGSLYYVAPEVLLRRYGPPADVWSAGVLMHVLLSGTLPFLAPTEAGTYAAVLAAKLHLSHAPWPALSRPARNLLRALLQRDPAARPTAAAALSHPWLRDVPRSGADQQHGSATVADVPLDAAALAALGRFARLGRLRRAALRALAAATPAGELPADVADQYAAVDADGDGRVTRRELRAALSRLADAARAAHAGAESGGEGSGGDGSDESGGSVAGSLLSEAEAGEAAAALDADGDDVITLRDFAAAALSP